MDNHKLVSLPSGTASQPAKPSPVRPICDLHICASLMSCGRHQENLAVLTLRQDARSRRPIQLLSLVWNQRMGCLVLTHGHLYWRRRPGSTWKCRWCWFVSALVPLAPLPALAPALHCILLHLACLCRGSMMMEALVDHRKVRPAALPAGVAACCPTLPAICLCCRNVGSLLMCVCLLGTAVTLPCNCI